MVDKTQHFRISIKTMHVDSHQSAPKKLLLGIGGDAVLPENAALRCFLGK